jgi:DNA-binding response OmpR family regulator
MTDAPAPPGGPSSGDLDATLAALHERHAAASENTVGALELIAARLNETPASPQLLTTLYRELHRVRGTTGGPGFGEVSRLAGAMEALAASWVEDPNLDRERRGSLVAQFARSIREALEHRGATDADDDLATAPRRLLLLDLPDGVASGLVAEGVGRGYRVERASRSELAEALARQRPTMIVSGAGALAPDEAPALPRVLLRAIDDAAAQVVAAPGQRVLDLRTDAREILDALELLEQLGGPAAGTVFIVDDDAVVCALLRSLVARDGLSVATYGSAAGCLAALKEADPLLFVLDVDLAKTSGVDLARLVRTDPAWTDVPIMMVTAHADAETRAAAFAAGADDYMVKPIVPAEFQRRLTRLIEARRRHRLASGVHAVTGLPLRARTLREVEARLGEAGEAPASVIVVRPAQAPADAMEAAAWRLEVVRLARGVRADGGIMGFLDDIGGLGGLLPLRAAEARRRLGELRAAAPREAPVWHAGISGYDATAILRPGALWEGAEASCFGARDHAVPARVWDPTAFDVAPAVVVVEHDDALAEMLAFALESRGLAQRRFATGPAALNALLLMRPYQHRPIVLLEVDLPGLSGHSLHERLRIDRPEVFDFVFLASHGSEADQLRALQSGALDYITKPVSLRVLAAKLASWRSRHGSA